MYDLAAVARKVKKDGVEEVINILLSGKLSDNIKTQLTSCGIFINGYPNLSLIYSLAS